MHHDLAYISTKHMSYLTKTHKYMCGLNEEGPKQELASLNESLF